MNILTEIKAVSADVTERIRPLLAAEERIEKSLASIDGLHQAMTELVKVLA